VFFDVYGISVSGYAMIETPLLWAFIAIAIIGLIVLEWYAYGRKHG